MLPDKKQTGNDKPEPAAPQTVEYFYTFNGGSFERFIVARRTKKFAFIAESEYGRLCAAYVQNDFIPPATFGEIEWEPRPGSRRFRLSLSDITDGTVFHRPSRQEYMTELLARAAFDKWQTDKLAAVEWKKVRHEEVLQGIRDPGGRPDHDDDPEQEAYELGIYVAWRRKEIENPGPRDFAGWSPADGAKHQIGLAEEQLAKLIEARTAFDAAGVLLQLRFNHGLALVKRADDGGAA